MVRNGENTMNAGTKKRNVELWNMERPVPFALATKGESSIAGRVAEYARQLKKCRTDQDQQAFDEWAAKQMQAMLRDLASSLTIGGVR